MGIEFQKKRPLAGAQYARTAEADVHGMQAMFREMCARIAVPSLWDHGGVVKEQRRRLDPKFFMPPLGELAYMSVSIIIRPV